MVYSMHQSFFVLLAFALGITTILCAPGVENAVNASSPNQFSLQGVLEMPNDGDMFMNQGGAMGDIQIVYHMSSRGANQDKSSAKTTAIDVRLVPRQEDGFNPGPEEVIVGDFVDRTKALMIEVNDTE